MNRLFILTIGLIGLVGAVPTVFNYSPGYTFGPDDYLPRENFHLFKVVFGRNYSTVDEEYARYQIFRQNFDRIYAWNVGSHNFTLDMNQFGDMTQSEFGRYIRGFRPTALRVSVGSRHVGLSGPLANSVDWRAKGVVNSVKDQGQCGSCYAFSAVQSIESAWAIKNGKLYDLAEQEIVDCDKVDSGCGGGLMDNVFQWVIENGGMEETSNYQYRAQDGKCQFDKSKAVVQLKGYVDVPANNNTALMEAVNMGPVSVAINAESYQFQFYRSGVFDWADCPNGQSDLDHGVGVVGYGTEGGKDYWIVRNSWGASWGAEGYILMARGEGVNQCGILDNASYPTLF